MRYDFKIDDSDNTTHGKVLRQIRAGSTVLECGCATGYMTQYLKDKLDCNVYIVENDKEAYEIAKQYSVGGSYADLNDENWSNDFKGIKFDYILFADVLEHLRNPEMTLSKAGELLKENGRIVVSLPNLSHNDVIINLLKNDFPYTERGLLDKTHIHFFALKTIIKMFNDCGFGITYFDRTILPTSKTELFWDKNYVLDKDLHNLLSNHSEGVVYQYVITAGKNVSNCKIDIPDDYDSLIQYLSVQSSNATKLQNKIKNYSSALFFSRMYSNSLTQKYFEINNQYNQLTGIYNQVINSRCYRLIKKYYVVRQKILPTGSKRLKTLKKFLNLFLKHKFAESTNNFINKTTVQPIKIKDAKKIDVLTTNHTYYLALKIKSVLGQMGIECDIFTKELEKYARTPYIVICPQMFKKLPPSYIAFQMEQTVSPRWMTEEYFNILRNAIAVLDYSLVNITYLRNDPEISNKIYYLPVDFLQKDYENNSEKEYDILFYGDISVQRRKYILKTLTKKYNVKIITDTFGEELYKEMRKAKIIINIHYYQNSLLETCRIYEALSNCDALIISESSIDDYEDEKLNDVVEFVPVDDVDALMCKLDYWLSHEQERKAKTELNKKILSERENAFDFYFYRLMLAYDRIEFDEFYNRCKNFVNVDERVCLSIPETVIRRDEFDFTNKYGIKVVPGLRHQTSWVGCGLSYKFLLRRAAEQQLEKMLICEDDVGFPLDFAERFEKLNDYIRQNDNWDIFSGVMADIGNVKILKIDKYGDDEYVYIDHIISMVFNFYNKSVFNVLEDWNPADLNVIDNTIDRYLEKKNLKILTQYPFLVYHKDFCVSTIWGHSNTLYSPMIKNSEDKLFKLIKEYKANSFLLHDSNKRRL